MFPTCRKPEDPWDRRHACAGHRLGVRHLCYATTGLCRIEPCRCSLPFPVNQMFQFESATARAGRSPRSSAHTPEHSVWGDAPSLVCSCFREHSAPSFDGGMMRMRAFRRRIHSRIVISVRRPSRQARSSRAKRFQSQARIHQQAGQIDPQSMAIVEYKLPESARPRRIAVDASDKIISRIIRAESLGRLDPATGAVKCGLRRRSELRSLRNRYHADGRFGTANRE